MEAIRFRLRDSWFGSVGDGEEFSEDSAISVLSCSAE